MRVQQLHIDFFPTTSATRLADDFLLEAFGNVTIDFPCLSNQ